MVPLKRSLPLWVSLVLCLLWPNPRYAQPLPTETSGPRVLAVSSAPPGATDRAGLGDLLIVEVRDYAALLAAAGGQCRNIVLFLEGMPFSSLKPLACNPLEGRVRFLLDRDDEDDPYWHALLGRPDGFLRQISVSIGPDENVSLPTNVRDFPLIVLRRGPFWLISVAILLIWVLAGVLVRKTDILRDPFARPQPGQKRPYSLARFQMGFWTLLTLSAYLFLWVIINELNTISESVLALIGIGSGTALGAAMIDKDKAEQGAVGRDGEDLTQIRGGSSGSFFSDVLESSAGVSLHRFQMLTWTLVLGIIFVASVYRTLEMPEFSATLLGLMGISSSTYLGFKFPERYSDTATKKPPAS